MTSMAMEAAVTIARRAVSKKKRRYQQEGFDLDLSYITNRIIAMGFPSTGSEALYRNPATEVLRFFSQKYQGHYRIYNLCYEKEYSILETFEQVDMNFRFKDHFPCPLDMLRPFCESVKTYLDEDERNVVSIHCKAGKGRTGLMICVLLVHLYKMTPREALNLFAEKRTLNSKGVTIPSQWRYVHYYHRIQSHKIYKHTEYRLKHVRMHTVPHFDLGGGCNPYFRAYFMWMDSSGKYQEEQRLDSSKLRKPKKYKRSDTTVDIDCGDFDLVCTGDVKFVFFDDNKITAPEKMFHFGFHTGFISNNYLCFGKNVVDKACKDKEHTKFDEDFRIELFFEKIVEDDSDATGCTTSR